MGTATARVTIAHQTVTTGDAIGHDILGMREALEDMGCRVIVFSENYGPGAEGLRPPGMHGGEALTSDLLIYHHSIYWEKGEGLLSDFKGRKAIKYHNVTPSSYFKPYCEALADATEKGRSQTARLCRRGDIVLLMGDSAYNCTELVDLGADPGKTRSVPPFHRVEELDLTRADRNLMEDLLSNGKVNCFFVSQVFPHKGHRHLISVARRFRDLFGERIAVWIAGSLYPMMDRYLEELRDEVSRLHLDEVVRFTGKISPAALKSFLLAASVFLCMSEHEGFCVPVVEAQYFGLPVVAYGRCAVRETVGPEQIVFDDVDYDLFASAVHTVASDDLIRDFLVERGWENYRNRFANSVITHSFIEAVRPVLGALP